jgi:hypothetical protein
MPLRLHAITMADAQPDAGDGAPLGMTAERHGNGPGGLELHLVPFRDLAAVVSDQKAFALDEGGPAAVEQHRAVVDAIFRRAAVLPAPVGVVFRSPEVLKRWMELHYVSLTGALEFVEDRAVARVHVVRADGRDEDRDAGADLAAAATEAFRALRRRAVAAVPLHVERVTGLMLSGAFLVDRDVWKDFLRAVEEQHDAHERLRFDVTGPWAPYDFVRMQFGG